MHFGAEHNLLQSIKVDLMPLFMGALRLAILSLRRLVQKTSTSTSEHDSSISSIDGSSYKGFFSAHFLSLENRTFRHEAGEFGRRRCRVCQSVRAHRYIVKQFKLSKYSILISKFTILLLRYCSSYQSIIYYNSNMLSFFFAILYFSVRFFIIFISSF